MTKKPGYAAALLLVVVAAQPLPADQGSGSETYRAWLPERPWVMVVDLPGFALEFNGVRPDGRRYLFGKNEASGVVFSALLEAAGAPATPEECRRHQTERAESRDFSKEDIQMSEEPGRTLLEYTIPVAGGFDLKQRNLFVCLPKDDVYIDLHFSKVRYLPGDKKLFRAILDTVRFADIGSFEYMALGSRFFLQRQYTKAIQPYEKALALEKQERQLEQNFWRVLVDNLGIAYGITGKLAEAKAVFEYGISQEPDYPLFHYNLACAYAEMGDAENAQASLRAAFEHKDNMIPGEKMPDPRQDPSFQPLMQKNPDFRRFLDSLMAGL
ncbi:MAG: hypothetical protein ACRD4U_02045 [Candidatus Acidiferrales bacterium]